MEEAPALGSRLRTEKGRSLQLPGGIGILEGAPRASAAPAPARSLARSREPAGGSPGGRRGTRRRRQAPGGRRRRSKPPSGSVAPRVREPGSRPAAPPRPGKAVQSLLGIGKSFKSLLAESEFLLSSGHAPSGNFAPMTPRLWGAGSQSGRGEAGGSKTQRRGAGLRRCSVSTGRFFFFSRKELYLIKILFYCQILVSGPTCPEGKKRRFFAKKKKLG